VNRLVTSIVVGAVLSAVSVAPADATQSQGGGGSTKPSSCNPSSNPLVARAAPVPGLTAQQVRNATMIINAGATMQIPQHGQTLAVMTALEASALGGQTPADQSPTADGGLGLFGTGSRDLTPASRIDPTDSAENFYQALTRVKNWQELPPTLAAHAAQRNLNPQAYVRWWPKAVRVVDQLTTGTGVAGLSNLAARAQAIADCEAATLRGRFAVSNFVTFVGPLSPDVLDSRAIDLAAHGGDGWFDRCQAFVAYLDGRPRSGYSTALDAWQTFEAEGVAHPVTSPDGVAPPPGAWLYYSSSNPAGHVVTYLGSGQVASTDVFGVGRVGVGPASAITDGPWHLQYLGWAPPWGQT
jgi:hypothetical protein